MIAELPAAIVTDALDRDGVESVERDLDGWLAELADSYDHIASVDKSDDDGIRWFVRMLGEEKEFTTVWLTLGQRTLRYETYVMPAPEENAAELYEQVLRRNDRLIGAHFSIGAEDGIFLRGEVSASSLTLEEMDRVLGTLYAQVEQCFIGLLRVGFASRFQT